MIDVRLSNRAQRTLLRGLAVLLDVIGSAKKANEKAFLSTSEHLDDVLFIKGSDDQPGLIDIIDGKANESLFADAHKTPAQLAWEKIGQMDEALQVELAEIGKSLAALPEGVSPLLMSGAISEALDSLRQSVLGMKHHEAVDYAERRQSIDMGIVTGDRAAFQGLTLIAGSALAQAAGFTGRPKPEPVTAEPEQATAQDDNLFLGDEG